MFNKTSTYDINYRLSLFFKILESKDIKSFNIMNFRTISKTESGLMANILIIIAIGNKIRVYDLYSNLLSEYAIDQEIKKVVTFHSNEGNINIFK